MMDKNPEVIIKEFDENERGEPDVIWLQAHGDADPADYPDQPVDVTRDEVTWCWEPIHEHDVKYIRADIAAPVVDDAMVKRVLNSLWPYEKWERENWREHVRSALTEALTGPKVVRHDRQAC
jgi:hypothetical protein